MAYKDKAYAPSSIEENRDSLSTSTQFLLLTLAHAILFVLIANDGKSDPIRSVGMMLGMISIYVGLCGALHSLTHDLFSITHDLFSITHDLRPWAFGEEEKKIIHHLVEHKSGSTRVYKIYYATKLYCLVNVLLVFLIMVYLENPNNIKTKIIIVAIALFYISGGIFMACRRIFEKDFNLQTNNDADKLLSQV